MNSFFRYIVMFAGFAPVWCVPGNVWAQQMQVKSSNYVSFLPVHPAGFANPDATLQHPEKDLLPWNTPCFDCYEDVSKRSFQGRHFVKKNGAFIQEQTYGTFFYTDGQGQLRTKDPHLYPNLTPGLYQANSQEIPTALNTSEGYTSMTLKNGFTWKQNHNLHFNNQQLTYRTHSVGKDGAWITEAWFQTDMELVFSLHQIKSNYILKNVSAINPELPYQVFTESFELAPDMYLVADSSQGVVTPDGWWKGPLLLMEGNTLLATIGTPWVIDQQRTKYHGEDQVRASGYKISRQGSVWQIELGVSTSWLLHPDRMFPVIVDPLLTGEGVYSASDIGFEFNTTCWDEADYCDYAMDVTVPGTTTLTAAYFDGTYYSQNFGCFFTTDCLMAEAAFRILGPCDDSPSPSSFWTCLPPVGDSSGTCYGVDLDMFNTISCIAPQCEDYIFSFEMRTFHCSCTKPPCDITCHYMPIDSWIITIEGLTVEETPIVSNTHPDFIICEGESIDLYAGGQWGVPGYYYEWLPDGITTDTFWVSPTEDTYYTSIIHDVCNMQDTVQQLVTVLPAPELSPGPFVDCYLTEANAGSGYADYVWSDGQTGQIATFTESGTYTVTVTDGNGCVGTSDPIEVTVNTYPEIAAQPDTVFVSNGELAEMEVTSTSPGTVLYNWTPTEQVTCTNCALTYGIVFEPLSYFYVTGTEFGCESPPDTVVVINEQTDLIVPNAFTPNADGLNDNFKPYSALIYPSYLLRVYSRWGTLLFETTDMLVGWDGTFEGTDQEIGTYIWVIEYERFNDMGRTYTLKGTVSLLR